ncbi:DNA replication protein DnaC [Lachnospiraceae bacterium TWA4]|nr:DNA replication protein DnaC [Lachnospiraceae bacterium TWA4]
MALVNTQYEEILRDYNRRQIQNQRDQDARKARVYEKVPRILEIEEEQTTLYAQMARKRLLGDELEVSKIKNQMVALKEEKEVLLQNYGFTKDYMDMQYQCPKCKDTGYIDNKKCECFKRREIDLLYTQSNLKEILEKENFDTFSMDWYDEKEREQMTKIAKACMTMIADFGNRPYNLVFTGPAGVGKTFLTHCIAKALIDDCFSVIYLSAVEFFDLLSKQNFEEKELDLQYLLTCDLLIVDDLGTELSNSFTVSKLFYCLNERALRKKSMVISTNLSMADLKELYTERIMSRLISDFTIFKMDGSDIRIKKKRAMMQKTMRSES